MIEWLNCNLTHINAWACFSGALLCGINVTITSGTHGCAADKVDYDWIKFCQKLSWVAVAMAMLWGAAYSLNTGWQPWPPAFGLVMAMNLKLVCNIVVAHVRKKVSYTSRLRRHLSEFPLA